MKTTILARLTAVQTLGDMYRTRLHVSDNDNQTRGNKKCIYCSYYLRIISSSQLKPTNVFAPPKDTKVYLETIATV